MQATKVEYLFSASVRLAFVLRQTQAGVELRAARSAVVAAKAQATKVVHLVSASLRPQVVATSVATKSQPTRVDNLVSASLRLVFDL